MDVGEAVVAPLEPVGQPLVVEAEQVHDGGLEVVHVHLVLGNAEAEFVGAAVAKAGLHAAAGHEQAEAVRVMVATEHLAGRGAAFAEGRTAELAAPDHQGVLEQTALLEVADQRCHRPIGGRHLLGEAVGEAAGRAGAVEIPAPVEELDEPHALLDQAARQQAVVGKARLARLGAVGLKHGRRLAGDVHDARHAGLHAVGQFVLGDAGDRLRMAELHGLQFVEFLQRVERAPAQAAVHAGGVGDVEHRVALAAALHALVDRRDEAAAPAALAAAGLHAAGNEGDKPRQVLVFRAQAVGGPGAHRRPALARVAGEQQQLGRGVVELVGVHRLHQRDVVGDAVEVRAGVAHPQAGLAVLAELAGRAHELRHAGGEGEGAALEDRVRTVLAVALHQLRLVIEQVEVRRRAGHVQVDDPLGTGAVVGGTRGQRIGRRRRSQGVQGDGAEAELAGAAEELPARAQLQGVVAKRMHGGDGAVSGA